jgi:uncharacterized protein YidB (DUF937 family)
MGVLDSLIGEMGGSLEGGPRAHQELLQGVMGMFANRGGLSGLVSMFAQGGLGDLVSSWVSTGKNLPISASQITQVLGKDRLGQLAAKAGLSPQAAGTSLAQLLPNLVDRLTPDGRMPEGGGGLVEGLMGLLGGAKR